MLEAAWSGDVVCVAARDYARALCQGALILLAREHLLTYWSLPTALRPIDPGSIPARATRIIESRRRHGTTVSLFDITSEDALFGVLEVDRARAAAWNAQAIHLVVDRTFSAAAERVVVESAARAATLLAPPDHRNALPLARFGLDDLSPAHYLGLPALADEFVFPRQSAPTASTRPREMPSITPQGLAEYCQRRAAQLCVTDITPTDATAFGATCLRLQSPRLRTLIARAGKAVPLVRADVTMRSRLGPASPGL